MSGLAEHGLTLHPFQPYPELEGFWSFSGLLENGWSAASVTYASVRAQQNVVEFQLSLGIGSHQNLMATGVWPRVLRPHANTSRIVHVSGEAHEIFLGPLGQFRLDTWRAELEGERAIGDFSIPRRAV